MSTLLPTDANNNVIPALRLKNGGAHSLSVTNASSKNSEAFALKTRVISLYATAPVYINFGNMDVTATSSDHYFPAGIYYDISIGLDDNNKYTHIAALRMDTDCTLYISEKE